VKVGGCRWVQQGSVRCLCLQACYSPFDLCYFGPYLGRGLGEAQDSPRHLTTSRDISEGPSWPMKVFKALFHLQQKSAITITHTIHKIKMLWEEGGRGEGGEMGRVWWN